MGISKIIFCVLFSPVILTQEVGAEEPPPPTSLEHAEVLHVAHDQSSVQVVGKDRRITLGAKTPEMKAVLRSLHAGDIVDIQYLRENGAGVLWDASVVVKQVGVWPRISALVLAAVGLLFLFWLMLRSGLPDLVIGTDNRYTIPNSRWRPGSSSS